MSGMVISLRGPSLFVAALSGLLIPILLDSNFHTIMCLVVLGFSILLTLSDLQSWWHQKYLSMQRNVRSWARGLVLDEFLQNLVGSYTNLVGGGIASLCGVVGVYSLPLTNDQRASITQCFLPENENANEVLFAQGGALRLLTDVWGPLLELDEGSDECEPGIQSADNQQMDVMQDMTWADDTDTSDGNETNQEELQEDITAKITKSVDSSPNTEGVVREAVTSHDSKMNPIASVAQVLGLPSSFPTKSISSVLVRIAVEKAKVILSDVDANSIQCVGVAASLALIVQLRMSRTARQVLVGVVHGMGIIGLSSLVVSVLMALKAKQRLKDTPCTCQTPTKRAKNDNCPVSDPDFAK